MGNPPSLLQVTVGSGKPLASHLKVTPEPSATMVSFEVSLYKMSGASTTLSFPIWNEKNKCGSWLSLSKEESRKRKNEEKVIPRSHKTNPFLCH